MFRRLLTAVLAVCAVIGAGCGAGPDGGNTSVVVTRDFGAAKVAGPQQVAAGPGLTAMRQLQKAHRGVTTSYGGRYVDGIEGVSEDADSSWLYYVDGVEAPRGAASIRLKRDQRVQWDFHAWQTIRTGGAIVGAFPRPLVSRGTRLVCQPARSRACSRVRTALTAAGVKFVPRSPVRVVVGRWSAIEGLDGVPDLTSSGDTNGAFAEFSRDGLRLTPFSADGYGGRPLSGRTGLLAPFANDDRVTWLVTGTDPSGVLDAAVLLGRPDVLRNRFAMMTAGGSLRPLPEGAGR